MKEMLSISSRMSQLESELNVTVLIVLGCVCALGTQGQQAGKLPHLKMSTHVPSGSATMQLTAHAPNSAATSTVTINVRSGSASATCSAHEPPKKKQVRKRATTPGPMLLLPPWDTAKL